ncbi:MAG: hypothetical protein A2Z35_04925 [Actinobacteria bacterium RBG_19FT_COMBO_36_27]|nr:MAG: hypothetical protein A2Z35_04925 [Actinobacteria bacterium RBG_19FT_COMBO_36_27]
MNTFKEIFLIVVGAILMPGGLGVILTAEKANGIMLIGGLMIVAGICIFIYLMKDALVEE